MQSNQVPTDYYQVTETGDVIFKQPYPIDKKQTITEGSCYKNNNELIINHHTVQNISLSQDQAKLMDRNHNRNFILLIQTSDYSNNTITINREFLKIRINPIANTTQIDNNVNKKSQPNNIIVATLGGLTLIGVIVFFALYIHSHK